MKKSFPFAFLVLEILLCLSSQNSFARKSKVILGVDAFDISTTHVFSSNADAAEAFVPRQKDSSSSNIGYGASLGYIAYHRKFFVAPEIFFDQLNSQAPDFFAPENDRVTGEVNAYSQDELAINYRYGARMSVGVNLFHVLDIYGNAGFANVDYDIRWNHPTSAGSRRSYGTATASPIYGFGMLINLNKNLIIRVSQDFQEINARYIRQGFVDSVTLEVTRVGVVAAF